MADFAITSRGDIYFVENYKSYNKLKISFYRTDSKSMLRIRFHSVADEINTGSSNSLIIRFDVNTLQYNKQAAIVRDNEADIQKINMILRTSLGELAERPEIGSTIETVIHKDINDQSIKDEIVTIITNALSDIIGEPIVKVYPVINTDNGYRQCMKVVIYNGNTLLTNYEMEW